jgi:hypothetical protein
MVDFRSPQDRAPTSTLPCDEFADELAAYSWGALEADERARLDRHRAGCPGCDGWLREAEHAVGQLDAAMPRIPPPPELRGRVLTSIEGMVQSVAPAASVEGPARVARSPVPAVSSAGAPHFSGRPGRQTLLPRGSGNWRPRTFLAGVTTGLVGALAAAVVIVAFVLRPQDLSGLTPRQSGYGSSDSGQPLLPGFLPGGRPAGPSARLLDLRSASTSARGWLMYDAETHRGVLLVEGLTPADGTQLDVWLTEGSQRVQLGTLPIDPRGVATFVLPEPLPLEHPDRIEVTPHSPAATDSAPLLTGGF